MLENKRKIRLPALSSIVCLQAGPLGQTLRALQICLVSALDRFENRTVSCTCLPAHLAHMQRRMDEFNGS